MFPPTCPGMAGSHRELLSRCHCEERSDEAISCQAPPPASPHLTCIQFLRWQDPCCRVFSMVARTYFVYIMTNRWNTVLYTGMTNNLRRRVYEHKHSLLGGFTSKYNVHKLVYYEQFTGPLDASTWEKKIKAGPRNKKIELIEEENPQWADLSDGWFD